MFRKHDAEMHAHILHVFTSSRLILPTMVKKLWEYLCSQTASRFSQVAIYEMLNVKIIVFQLRGAAFGSLYYRVLHNFVTFNFH